MRAIRCEAMDDRVAVAVGDIDLAVRRDRDAGGVVERRLELRRVPRADGAGLPAFRGEDEDLMGIAVHQQDATVGRDGQAVRVCDPFLAPGRMHATVRVEDDHRRLGALVGVHPARRVHGDGADEPERRLARCLPPGALHTVPPLAHAHNEITVEGHNRASDPRESGGSRRSAAVPPNRSATVPAGPWPSATGLRLFATLRYSLTTPCAR